jgi:hypothetical protein
MTEAKTYDVVVHKANLPMMKNESINEYTCNLSKAGSEAVRKSLGMTGSKHAYAYMVEAFADTAVFYASDYDQQGVTKSKSGYYATIYKRDDKGVFNFSAFKEVVRVTRFEAPAGSDSPTESTVIATKKSAEPVIGNEVSQWQEVSIFKGLI